MPDLTVDYDMKKREFTILQQDVVEGLSENSNPTGSPLKKLESRNMITWRDLSEKYHCERREVKSHDGISVPLTILYSGSKDIQNSASAGILHGYGAYGEVLDKSWCADRLSLLDRGWVVAFADVRYKNVVPVNPFSLALGGFKCLVFFMPHRALYVLPSFSKFK